MALRILTESWGSYTPQNRT